MKTLKFGVAFLMMLWIVLGQDNKGWAAGNISSFPHSTSLNCSEWSGDDPDYTCDGILFQHGAQTLPNASITSCDLGEQNFVSSIDLQARGVPASAKVHLTYLDLDGHYLPNCEIASLNGSTVKVRDCVCNSGDPVHNAAYGGAGHTFPLGYAYGSPWCISWKNFQLFTTYSAGQYDYNDGVNKGKRAQITSAANNPLGSGKGIRVWSSDASSGIGGTDGLSQFFPPTEEIWLRYYVRFGTGFRWYPYIVGWKLYRLWPSSADNQVIPYFIGPDTCSVIQDINARSGTSTISKDGCGWNSMMGGKANCDLDPQNPEYCLSDNKFHAIEFHAKHNSSLGQSDGIVELWIDGGRKFVKSDVKFGGTAVEWGSIQSGNLAVIGTNTLWGVPLDYDDIALSTTGYIGLLNGNADTQAPTAPSEVNVN